jgi:hypothetical protein
VDPASAEPIIIGVVFEAGPAGEAEFTLGAAGAVESSMYVIVALPQGDSAPFSWILAENVVLESLLTVIVTPVVEKRSLEPEATTAPVQLLVA